MANRSLADQLVKELPVNPDFSYLIFEYSSQRGIDVTQQDRHDIVVEPGQVYWVLQETSLELKKGRLLLRPTLSLQPVEKTLNHILSMVAATAPGRHVVLIAHPPALEKLGAGLRVVRAEGGYSLMVAGDEDHPYRRPGIDAADIILPAAEVVKRLSGLLDRFQNGQSVALNDGEEAELAQIYLLLLHEKGVDFSRHRKAGALRHIHRRMVVHCADTLKSYFEILRDDIEELTLLNYELQTCLIGFFTEPAIEAVLTSDILPRLLAGRGPAPLRVWMPRCSGGEPVYSFAILLLEYLQERKSTASVQIFATDLNIAAIKRARIGIFEDEDLAGLSAPKLKKYFIKQPDGLHVSQAVRDICVFATQNLLTDPPFSNVDLILGQSLLVGVGRDTMARIFRSLHYALSPTGYFLPGKTRSKDYPQDLFTLTNDDPTIFTPKDTSATFEATFAVSTRRPEQEADRLLLAEYVPAAMLIDEHFRILRFYGNTAPFLKLPADRLSLHLLRMVKDELVFELGELIEESDKLGKVMKKEGIALGADKQARKVSIEVAPLQSAGRKWRLIVLREMPVPQTRVKLAGRVPNSKDLRILAQERELDEMRRLLLAANEDASSIQVVLQQANEEIMASNEELQSVNEQLQSVNDELTSSNVELNTVNEDLSVRNQQLGLSVEYAHTIVGSLRRPVVVLQEDLSIRTANPAFCHFFGLNPAAIAGQSLWTVGGGIMDRKELRAAFTQMRSRKDGAMDIETHIEVSPQRERALSFSITRMQKVKNVRAGWVMAAEDITDRKMAERLKDEFISIASHELKTPATTIQAYSQLLYQELLESNNQQPAELARKLTGQVARLTRLTKDLLDVTRISQGQVNFRREVFNMDNLIGEAVEELQLTTSLRLLVTSHPPLPFITGDRERIGQVLANILTNAIKFAPESKEIMIRPETMSDRLTVSVQDFGMGMSPETLRKIFDPFYRSDDPFAGRHPGVGLGLYISLEIIRRHGGEITVNSEKDKGSTFTIHLPIN